MNFLESCKFWKSAKSASTQNVSYNPKNTEKLESTIPGLKYPAVRDALFQTSFGFLASRRKDDGAEGLWRVNDNLYDLKDFVKYHPGGAEWLTMTKDTDITEAFEAHHLTDKAEAILPKYFVRKAITPRVVPYKNEPNGFHKKFKARALEALKDVDYHNPSTRSKIIADVTVTLTTLSSFAVVYTKSRFLIVVSGLLLAWTTAIGHNFFHMKDNFRMYYFDLGLLSSKEWRISHGLSHHLYPNTLWDVECYAFEPFATYLPRQKSLLYKIFSTIIHVPAYSFVFFATAFKRYLSLLVEWRTIEFRDVVPFFLPASMSLFASSPREAIKLWSGIVAAGSFFFILIALNGAHHHPEIFHDGDIPREEADWALMVLDAVRDRKVIDDSTFLALTSFGSHAMHHMLPTVDHDYLPLCLPAFHETCREFGVDVESLTPWQAIKGNFRQIVRSGPKANFRGGPDCGPMRA